MKVPEVQKLFPRTVTISKTPSKDAADPGMLEETVNVTLDCDRDGRIGFTHMFYPGEIREGELVVHARLGAEEIGYMIIEMREHGRIGIELIEVAPEYRRCGLGRMMVESLPGALYAHVACTREFWRSLGFEPVLPHEMDMRRTKEKSVFAV